MQKAISSWESFHCKNPKFLRPKVREKPPCSEGAEKGSSILLGNFGDVDPNHFFTTGGPGSLVNPSGCINIHAMHFTLTSAHQLAYEKHSKKKQLGKCLESWEMFAHSVSSDRTTAGLDQLRCATKWGPNISWPINTTSTILSYCKCVGTNFEEKFFGFLPLPFTLQNMVSAVSKSCLPAFFLRSGIRHPWIYVCKVGSVTRGSTSFNPTFVVALSEAIS